MGMQWQGEDDLPHRKLLDALNSISQTAEDRESTHLLTGLGRILDQETDHLQAHPRSFRNEICHVNANLTGADQQDPLLDGSPGPASLEGRTNAHAKCDEKHQIAQEEVSHQQPGKTPLSKIQAPGQGEGRHDYGTDDDGQLIS
jgi:hypothetical protein